MMYQFLTHRLFPRFIAVLAGLALTPAADAHHSQSEFDKAIKLDLTGTVTNLEWKSPHARLYVDVVDDNGDTVNWNFELPSPNTMMRRGWTRKALLPGDQVNVTGYRARNYPTIGIARMVRDESGKPLLTGATPDY